MKSNNQKGFGAVGILITIIVVGLVGFAGWYVWQANKEDKGDKSSSTGQQTDTAKKDEPSEDKYKSWQEVTLPSEKVTIKVPPAVNLGEMTLPSSASGPTQTTIPLERGYVMQISELGDPKTDNSYGNTDKASEYDKFSHDGKDYYIVNSGVSLSVSTCPAQVCALPSKQSENKSILVQVYYRDPAMTGQQAPDDIPTNDAYLETVKLTLKSLHY